MGRRIILSVLLCTALSVCFFCACSVKEDRSNCPCLLELTYIQNGAVEGDALICFGARNSAVRDSCRAESFNSPRTLLCKRGTEILYGIARKSGGAFDSSKAILIPEGCQSDSIYSCSRVMYLNAEDAQAQIFLHKQFMTLHFVCRRSRDTFGEFPYSIIVRGEVDGFDAVAGLPHEGVFTYALSPGYGSDVSVRLPRQGNGGLYVDMMNKDGSGLYSRLDLKALLQAEGYDWTAEDLEDMYLVLNTDEIGFHTQVKPWESIETELYFK